MMSYKQFFGKIVSSIAGILKHVSELINITTVDY